MKFPRHIIPVRTIRYFLYEVSLYSYEPLLRVCYRFYGIISVNPDEIQTNPDEKYLLKQHGVDPDSIPVNKFSHLSGPNLVYAQRAHSQYYGPCEDFYENLQFTFALHFYSSSSNRLYGAYRCFTIKI